MKKIFLAILCIILSNDFAFGATSTGCNAGYYPTGIGGCTPCDLGTWSNAGATSCSNCQMPDGAQGTTTGNTSATSCSWKLTCDAGKYWNGSKCASCFGTGRYSDSETTYTGTGTSLGAQQCKFACTLPAITNDNGTGCKCPDNNYTQNGNTCEPKVYEITLDKNCTLCTVKEGKFYEKYSIGFANSESGAFVAPDKFKVNLDALNTDRWFGYELAGYYLSTSKYDNKVIVGTDGSLAIDIDSKFFKEHKTLYAHWNGKTYNINYTGDNAPTANNPQNCKFGNNCFIQNPTQKPNGLIFNGWKCTDGCSESIVVQGGNNFKDQEDKINKFTITLTAQWSQCPKGSYCENNISTPCPAGSTSDYGATSIDDCVIKRGNGGTQFCDSVGCFYLPGTGSIPY